MSETPTTPGTKENHKTIATSETKKLNKHVVSEQDKPKPVYVSSPTHGWPLYVADCEKDMRPIGPLCW